MKTSQARNLEPAPTAPLTSQPVPLSWIESLFARFTTMYGARFIDLWANVDQVDLKNAWAHDLAGYTGEEIKRGLAACKTWNPTFPPSLLEFMALCRPTVTAEAAYYEAILQMPRRASGGDAWSHLAIYWTAARIGSHDLQTSSWQTMKSRWTVAFDSVMASGVWPQVPPHREALPAPGQQSISREDADKRMSEIKGAASTVGEGTGSKLWAKRILTRINAGETLSITVERFAREVAA